MCTWVLEPTTEGGSPLVRADRRSSRSEDLTHSLEWCTCPLVVLGAVPLGGAVVGGFSMTCLCGNSPYVVF